MIEIVGSVIGALAGLATLVQTYFALRKDEKQLTPERAARLIRDGETGRGNIGIDDVLLAKLSVIRPSILDAAARRIQDAEERFARSITDPRMTPEQQDQEAKIAQAQICSLLQLIKDHNRNTLPSKELDSMWASFLCDAPGIAPARMP